MNAMSHQGKLCKTRSLALYTLKALCVELLVWYNQSLTSWYKVSTWLFQPSIGLRRQKNILTSANLWILSGRLHKGHGGERVSSRLADRWVLYKSSQRGASASRLKTKSNPLERHFYGFCQFGPSLMFNDHKSRCLCRIKRCALISRRGWWGKSPSEANDALGRADEEQQSLQWCTGTVSVVPKNRERTLLASTHIVLIWNANHFHMAVDNYEFSYDGVSHYSNLGVTLWHELPGF